MNFKKNWKRFWTLSSAREGFTLVELIVVIAILAILAGVAVPAYSGYVKKANMQADITLISEVKHALALGYYSGLTPASGYVVLTESGAVGDGSEGIDLAMTAVFGDNWDAANNDSLSLKYDGWVVKSSVLNAALNGNGEAVTNSSYITNSNVGELLDNVQTVTMAAAGMLGSVLKDEAGYIQALELALGSDYLKAAADAGIINVDANGEYSLKEGTFTQNGTNIAPSEELQNQLANLMVFSVANELQSSNTDADQMMLLMLSNSEDITTDDVSGYSSAAIMASQYALFKAYAVDTGNEAEFNQMTLELNNATCVQDVQDIFQTYYSNNKAALETYIENNDETFMNNTLAIPSVMDGVAAVNGDYTTADSLKDASLFTSGAVASDVNAFVGASALSDAQIQALLSAATDGIVVFISGDKVQTTID